MLAFDWSLGPATAPEAITLIVALIGIIFSAINTSDARGDLDWVRRYNLNGQRERWATHAVRQQQARLFQLVIFAGLGLWFCLQANPLGITRNGLILWGALSLIEISIVGQSIRERAARVAILQRESANKGG